MTDKAPAQTKPPQRTTVQITAISASESHRAAVLALCGDGTIWMSRHEPVTDYIAGGWLPWEQLPPIPAGG